jgi:RNA polymerase sigma-70 factor (ECF subfamily)
LELKKTNGFTDKALIEAYLDSRDTANFTELYQRYSGKVYSKCLTLLNDEGLAHEATQDVFLKVYLNLPKFKFNSTFSTWVYSITYNLCIDTIRKQKRERKLFSEVVDISNVAIIEEDFDIEQLKASHLKKVLNKIPPGDRAVLLMKYQDDMSIKDISNILDKSESAIKMRIKRAKDKARECHATLFDN